MKQPTVQIIDDIGLETAWLSQLVQTVQAVLTHQGASAGGGLRIMFADDATLRELNREFMGLDQPTDVLSFGADELTRASGDLGDLAVSVPRARRQADRARHTLLAELQLLVTHGVLHLLGHDHATEAEKKLMWQAQAEILASLGVTVTLPA